MNLKNSFKDQSTIASFTTLIEKKFLFFSFIYHVILKKPTSDKSNTVQTIDLALKKVNAFLLGIENNEPLFAQLPQTNFLS